MLQTKTSLGMVFLGLLLCSSAYGNTTNHAKPQYVSPRPGATFVSPRTTIIIRPGGKLDFQVLSNNSTVVLQCFDSHKHTGQLSLSDDGETLVFSPDQPFCAGEEILASVRGFSLADGRVVAPFTFAFMVTPQDAEPSDGLRVLQGLREKSTGGGWGMDPKRGRDEKMPGSARNLSDDIPIDFPYLKVIELGEPSPGQIFMSTFSGNRQKIPYMMILQNNGFPVFYKKLSANAFDFKVQPNGMLTYYDNQAGCFYGLNSTYAIVDSFACGGGYVTDMHDLQVLPNGHALLMSYDPKKLDMSKIVPGGKPDATVVGLVIQEIDRDKKVVFEWRSWDHFLVTDATHENLSAATIDYVHGNALEFDTDGNILLSSRHLDEITKISRETGEIIWRWGGKNNQFRFVNDPIQFSYQHDIRRLPNGNVTLFDNGNFHTPRFSRAVEYRLDEQLMTAELVWEYRASPDIFGGFMGNAQRLPSGNTIICWGSGSKITEVRADGSKVFEIELEPGVYSYRAFRFPWGTDRADEPPMIPTSFAMSQNYPNPFNSSTIIEISIPEETHVSLKVYDVLGRVLATLIDGPQRAGVFFARIEASGLSSGIYFCRLVTDRYVETKKMVLAK